MPPGSTGWHAIGPYPRVMGRAGTLRRLVTVLTLALATACSSSEAPPSSSASPDAAASSSGPGPGPGNPSPSPSAATSATPTPPPTPPPPARAVRAGDFRVDVALRTVQHLAGTIGPRHATSPAYRRAARWTTGELTMLGYDVRLQPVDVPGGSSWGVPVAAGTSRNVVATPPGFDQRMPHLVVGAHLDTVPQAPGAEDNASGVGVLLAVADALQQRRTRLPVVLVAFGAEEPRGDTDAAHHYGSRAYVASLAPGERRAVRGMLSLDRVGAGAAVPVCAAIGEDPVHREEALAAGRRADVATLACENSSSDHWSFVRQGLPGVRIGGTSYAAYHSAADVPSVVSRLQVERVGRLVLAWLAGPGSG